MKVLHLIFLFKSSHTFVFSVILEMVKLREQQKRDLLHTTIKILETRYDVHIFVFSERDLLNI